MAMSDELFKALLFDLKDELPPGFKPGDQWSVDLTPRQVAAVALAKSLLKKYSASDRTTSEGDAKAAEKFHASNRRCESWSYSPNTSLDEELLGEFKYTLYKFFYPGGLPLIHSYYSLFFKGRSGPGASIGARGEDFYTKHFDSPLTCTSRLLEAVYHSALANDDQSTWSAAEFSRNAIYGEVEFVQGSRFSFVPKDDTTSRLIAIEPSLNMFFQLGLGRLLEERLVTFFGLDITSQPQINQEAARFGSVTDALATLDLSDASDSLGLPMLKWALPSSIFELLQRLRSPTGTLFNEPLGLHMVSTMGNGFTFPLETLVFSAIVVSCIKSFRRKPVRPYRTQLDPAIEDSILEGYWGVFGDDIICHRKVAGRVVHLLSLLGFVVNRDKSFIEGPFRESCGRDFFMGHDVRGVYLKRLDNAESRYAAINALNVWSAKTGILLLNTVRRLVDSVKWNPVPPSENHDAGIRVPSLLVNLNRKGNGLIMYESRVSNPKALTILDGEIRVPRRVKRRLVNPEGLLLAFLHGSVKSGRITLRAREVRYRTKRRVIPFWDYLPSECDIASLCGWQRWESAAFLNLS
jgi:hypothetical protein